MKHITKSVCFLLSLCIVFLFGCGKSQNHSDNDYKDGIIGENKNWKEDSKKGLEIDGVVDTAEFSDAEYRDASEYQIDVQAGTLTAGEWKDRMNIKDWLSLTADNEWQEELNRRGLYSDKVIPVHVTENSTGNNLYGAKASLKDDDGNVIYTAVTDIDGMAYLFCTDDRLNKMSRIVVGDTIMLLPDNQLRNPIEISTDIKNVELKELDLMLMVDTTGSMGDELEYLKAELADVVERVAKDTELYIRISVNFYRDEGDEYVVKYFDFRNDVKECVKQISDQSADGGGDYPEAVHIALKNAVEEHEWREDAVKLCFLVLDAPAHDASEIQDVDTVIINALTTAAENGIRIVPVASSGVDKNTEIDLRSYAIMTGGTYIFLTDDSGVGNEHLEASVGEYTVEPLNKCMVRVINEYCGVKTTTEPAPTTEPSTEEPTTANPNYPEQP